MNPNGLTYEGARGLGAYAKCPRFRTESRGGASKGHQGTLAVFAAFAVRHFGSWTYDAVYSSTLPVSGALTVSRSITTLISAARALSSPRLAADSANLAAAMQTSSRA